LGIDPPKVIIVIVSYNKRDLLAKCLDSIEENTSEPEYEIIVVDNGSKDGTDELLKERYPRVKIIRNETNVGFAKANNQAMREALKNGPKYFFLLNNDTTVHRGWLEEAVKLAESQADIGIVGGKLLFPDGKIQHAGGILSPKGPLHVRIRQDNSDLYDRVAEVDFVLGAALLIKRDVIEKIGLFDEGFSPAYFEEVDWCTRARRSGYKILYSPRSTITHHLGATAREFGDYWFDYVYNKNNIRFVLVNYSIPWLILNVPHELKLVFSLFFTVRRHGDRVFKRKKNWTKRLKLYGKAWKENIQNLDEILEKRKDRTKKIW